MLALALLIGCSASYTSKNQSEYNCNLDKGGFVESTKQILSDFGFVLVKLDDEDGYIEFASENFKKEDAKVCFKFNEKDNSVIAYSIVKTDEGEEYYTKDCYRDMYKDLIVPLEYVYNNCTKVSFPNPPGN